MGRLRRRDQNGATGREFLEVRRRPDRLGQSDGRQLVAQSGRLEAAHPLGVAAPKNDVSARRRSGVGERRSPSPRAGDADDGLAAHAFSSRIALSWSARHEANLARRTSP